MKAYTEETEPGWGVDAVVNLLCAVIAIALVSAGIFIFGLIEFLGCVGLAAFAFALWPGGSRSTIGSIDPDVLGRWIVGNHRSHGGTLRSYRGYGAFPIEDCTEEACVNGARILEQLRKGPR